MISVGIDGKPQGGTNDAFALLSLIANPDEYTKKLKALTDATAEHQKYVALIGPASEITKLREDAQKAKEGAEAELAAAKAEAKKIKADADAKAKDVLEKAQAKAKDILSDADAIKSALAADSAQIQQMSAKVTSELYAAQKATEEAKAAMKAADAAKAAAELEKNAAVAERGRLMSWHNNAVKELSK